MVLTAAARLAAVLLDQESPNPVSRLSAAARTRQDVTRRVLRRMTDRGWIQTSQEERGAGSRARLLFEVTEEGRAGLPDVAAGKSGLAP